MSKLTTVFIALLAVQAGGVPSGRADSTWQQDDVAVLAAVLSTCCDPAGATSYFVVPDQHLEVTDFISGALPSSPEVRELLERNATPGRLPDFQPCACMHVEPASEVRAALKAAGPPSKPPQPGWEGFYFRYKGARGIFRVTLPGYTADHTAAVVVVGGSCGPLCGSGFLHHLEKKNGNWQVVRRATLWVS